MSGYAFNNGGTGPGGNFWVNPGSGEIDILNTLTGIAAHLPSDNNMSLVLVDTGAAKLAGGLVVNGSQVSFAGVSNTGTYSTGFSWRDLATGEDNSVTADNIGARMVTNNGVGTSVKLEVTATDGLQLLDNGGTVFHISPTGTILTNQVQALPAGLPNGRKIEIFNVGGMSMGFVQLTT